MPIRFFKYKMIKRNRRRKHVAEVLPYSHCKNCGQELHGMYCSKCGQFATKANSPFAESVKLYLEHHYGLDHKLGTTLRYLFFRPGFLAREYMEGRIERHVHPFKLYFFASILLFGVALSFHSSSESKGVEQQNRPLLDTTSTGDINLHSNKSITFDNSDLSDVKDSAQARQQLDSAAGLLNAKLNRTSTTKKSAEKSFTFEVDEDGKVSSTSGRLMKNITGVSRKELAEKAVHYLSLSVLFLMPVFALLLQLVYRRKERYYTGHLILSIHQHVVLFIAISLSLLWERLVSDEYTIGGWMFLAMLVYFVLSLSNFYGEKIIKSALKSIRILLGYFFVCLMVAIGIGILVFLY